MFNRPPRKQQSGVLAVLALLLVGVACDLDSHTAPPPKAPPEPLPEATAEELAFSPDAVYLVSEDTFPPVVVVYDPRSDRRKVLDRRILVAFETVDAFDLHNRFMRPHETIELADSSLEPMITYSYHDVQRFIARFGRETRRDLAQR